MRMTPRVPVVTTPPGVSTSKGPSRRPRRVSSDRAPRPRSGRLGFAPDPHGPPEAQQGLAGGVEERSDHYGCPFNEDVWPCPRGEQYPCPWVAVANSLMIRRLRGSDTSAHVPMRGHVSPSRTPRSGQSTSVMISVLVRASNTTSPRGERNFLISGASSAAFAYESV